MTVDSRGFLRNNAFLVAAVALPAIIAVFFVVANTVPRWTVPDPAYDAVVRAARTYDATPATITVDFLVREGRIDAVVRLAPPNLYAPPPALFLFDHETLRAREIPIDLPDILAEGEVRTIPVDAFNGRRVVDEVEAPDGYRVETDRGARSGIVGEIFGMSRYRSRLSLTRSGRIIPIELPPPYDAPYMAGASLVGWVVDDER